MVGGPLGGGFFGAMRRPMPPKKRWETAFEAWAGGGGEGFAGGAAASGAGGDEQDGVEARYPSLVKRAEESDLVTIREVRRAAGAGAGAGAGGGGGGDHTESVVVCRVVANGGVEVRGERRCVWERPDGVCRRSV